MATVDQYEFPGDRWYDAREHLWVLVETDAPRGADSTTLGRGGALTGRIGEDAAGIGSPAAEREVSRERSALTVKVGIDALGEAALGEVVYVQLGEVGRVVRRGEALGSLEAEKMVRPVLAPVSGTVLEVNDAVMAAPRLLNRDPYGDGWLCRIRASRWTAERGELLHGDDAVTAWARAEIEASR